MLSLPHRGDWAGPQPAQAPPRCTKCNSPPINGKCTIFHRIIYIFIHHSPPYCCITVRCFATIKWLKDIAHVAFNAQTYYAQYGLNTRCDKDHKRSRLGQRVAYYPPKSQPGGCTFRTSSGHPISSFACDVTVDHELKQGNNFILFHSFPNSHVIWCYQFSEENAEQTRTWGYRGCNPRKTRKKLGHL